jgi:hypothetical protein
MREPFLTITSASGRRSMMSRASRNGRNDTHPARGEATIQTCLKPGFLGNVTLAAEPRVMTQLK